jgi:hypothetical protein
MNELLLQLSSCLAQLQALQTKTAREAIAAGHAEARLHEAILWLATAVPRPRADTE